MSTLDQLSLLVRSNLGAVTRRGGGDGEVSTTRAELLALEQRLDNEYEDTLDSLSRVERLLEGAAGRAPDRVAKAERARQKLQGEASELRKQRDAVRERLLASAEAPATPIRRELGALTELGETLRRAEAKIDATEAQLELDAALTGASLDAEFAKLNRSERTAGASLALDRLRRAMNGGA